MFIILSTLIMIVLGFMWRSNDPVNLTIKFCIFGMGVWGIFLIAQGAY